MKIVKIILPSIWILIILGLFLNIQYLKEVIKSNELKSKEVIHDLKPCVEMYGEYYLNVSYLIEKTDCKNIAMSIFNNSAFLKDFDKNYKKVKKKR